NPCTPGHVPTWAGNGILSDAGTDIQLQVLGALSTQFMQFNVGGSPVLNLDSLIHMRTMGASPAVSGCGSGASVSGSDIAGQITSGTGSPTGCVLTFAQSYLNAPYCIFTWQTNLASMQWTVTASQATLVQTATSSNKVNYLCLAQSGG